MFSYLWVYSTTLNKCEKDCPLFLEFLKINSCRTSFTYTSIYCRFLIYSIFLQFCCLYTVNYPLPCMFTDNISCSIFLYLDFINVSFLAVWCGSFYIFPSFSVIFMFSCDCLNVQTISILSPRSSFLGHFCWQMTRLPHYVIFYWAFW